MFQHPGHCHPVQCDHHPADDVQHLRVPGGPGFTAAGAFPGPAAALRPLPEPQHLLPLLDHGTEKHLGGDSRTYRLVVWSQSLPFSFVCVRVCSGYVPDL